MQPQTLKTTCCVVGGGPAGIMLGYLLARAGVPVTVLEKHQDFFRGFRGDTVHPSTLHLMYELGLLEEFLKVPHQQLTSAGGIFGDYPFTAADFRFRDRSEGRHRGALQGRIPQLHRGEPSPGRGI